MNCDFRREQVLLYLTDGLEPAEQGDIEAHLEAGCPQCTAFLAEGRDMLGQLCLAAPPTDPDASLRERLLDRVRQDCGDVATAPAATAAPATAPIASDHRWRISPVANLFVPAAAAVLAAVVTTVILSFDLRESRERFGALESDIAILSDELRSSHQQLARLQSSQQLSSTLHALVHSPSLHVVPLQGHEPDGGYWGRLFLDNNMDLAYVFAPSLEAIGSQRRFSLWFTSEDEADTFQAGEFTVGDLGVSGFPMRAPTEPQRYTRAVILAPEAEADDQTGAGVLFGPLHW